MKLTFNSLEVNASGIPILRGINFSILPGGIFNFHGPNGVGKTRLLKTIAHVGGKKGAICINNNPKAASDSTYIGLDMHLYASFTVQKNLEFIARLHNNEIALAAAVHVFELTQYLNTKYGNLSTGWKRKVLLATLLLSNSSIWIIDEPFSSLDEYSKKRLEEVIVSKAANGGIVIITSQTSMDHPEVINFNLEERKIEEQVI